MSNATQAQNTGKSLDVTLTRIAEEYKLNTVEARYLGPILKYLETPNIREIIINKPGEIGFEYPDGSWEWKEAPELTLEQLEDAARMLANFSGGVFTPTHPLLSCKLPGGHRVQVVAGHLTTHKFNMSIRIQQQEKFTIDNYNLSESDKELIIDAIKTKKTLLISGGTSTGKTSFMNAVIPFIPEYERLITMEDVAELKVPHKNWAPLIFAGANRDPEGKQIREILNACLRMRPDRIILGEIRKENAFAFCTAINTGHEGSLATIHANTPKMAIDAVLNRVMLNGDIPESALNVLKRQLEADIYAVIQLTREGSQVKGYVEVLQ